MWARSCCSTPHAEFDAVFGVFGRLVFFHSSFSLVGPRRSISLVGSLSLSLSLSLSFLVCHGRISGG